MSQQMMDSGISFAQVGIRKEGNGLFTKMECYLIVGKDLPKEAQSKVCQVVLFTPNQIKCPRRRTYCHRTRAG